MLFAYFVIVLELEYKTHHHYVTRDPLIAAQRCTSCSQIEEKNGSSHEKLYTRQISGNFFCLLRNANSVVQEVFKGFEGESEISF